jgi:hypothetical protein
MYTVLRNDGCGNCLFYAIAQGIIHKKNLVATQEEALGEYLRKMAVKKIKQKMKSNRTYRQILSTSFKEDVLESPFINGDYSKAYVKWMSGSAWGGDIEIKALKEQLTLYGLAGVRVYYADTSKNGRTQLSLRKISNLGTKVSKVSKDTPLIRIILHDASELGSHYEYIYKKKQQSPVIPERKNSFPKERIRRGDSVSIHLKP